MLKAIIIVIGTVIFSGYPIKLATSQDGGFDRDLVYAANGKLLQGSSPYAVTGKVNNNLAKILIFSGLISGVGIVGWYLSRQGKAALSSTVSSKFSQKALIDRVNPRLRRKLLRLINDPKTANRLLMGIYQHHRDRSPDWLAEKVIYDLQRGR